MSKLWYVLKDGRQNGPYGWDELLQQKNINALAPSDMVWSQGMDGWINAWEVEGLFPKKPSQSPASLGTGQLKKGKGKGLLIAAVVFLTVGLLGGGLLVYNLLSPGSNGPAAEGVVENDGADGDNGDAGVDGDNDGSAAALSVSEQGRLAVELFNEIADMDMWELEEMEQLYFQIMEEAPDTDIAQESYWYLSNMYMQAFKPSRYDDAIIILERYRELYPDSTLLDEKYSQFAQHGFPVVENRLLRLYDEVRDKEKSAGLYLELIPDPAATPDNQLDHLLSYGLSMEKVGRVDEAIIAYQTYLDRKEDPPSFMIEMAEGRLRELERD